MRVAIIGNSGSGKSTLAAAIAAETGVPCLDLDSVAWEPSQPAVARDEALALADVHAFCSASDGWIVEGCYATLVSAALQHAPKLLFSNPGLDACLTNCRARPWEPHKYASKQAQDANLEFLLSWVAEYYERSGPMSLAAHVKCFETYSGPKRELRSIPALRELERDLMAWLR